MVTKILIPARIAMRQTHLNLSKSFDFVKVMGSLLNVDVLGVKSSLSLVETRW